MHIKLQTTQKVQGAMRNFAMLNKMDMYSETFKVSVITLAQSLRQGMFTVLGAATVPTTAIKGTLAVPAKVEVQSVAIVSQWALLQVVVDIMVCGCCYRASRYCSVMLTPLCSACAAPLLC